MFITDHSADDKPEVDGDREGRPRSLRGQAQELDGVRTPDLRRDRSP